MDVENEDFRREVDFCRSRRDCLAALSYALEHRRRVAEASHSINDSFEGHYGTRSTDEPTKRHPSGSGVSFASLPLGSHTDRHREHGFEEVGTIHMPHYRRLLNEVFGAAQTEGSSLSGPLASPSGASARATEGSDHECGGLALQDRPGHAYNEEAFQYFLEIERKRSELSNRSFLLMLVDFKKQPRIDAATADKLFSVLSLCLRETDFIGWYREERIAGAVLTQHGETEGDDLPDVVRQRMSGALRRRLPSSLARQLQARVYQIPPNVKSGSK